MNIPALNYSVWHPLQQHRREAGNGDKDPEDDAQEYGLDSCSLDGIYGKACSDQEEGCGESLVREDAYALP